MFWQLFVDVDDRSTSTSEKSFAKLFNDFFSTFRSYSLSVALCLMKECLSWSSELSLTTYSNNEHILEPDIVETVMLSRFHKLTLTAADIFQQLLTHLTTSVNITSLQPHALKHGK